MSEIARYSRKSSFSGQGSCDGKLRGGEEMEGFHCDCHESRAEEGRTVVICSYCNYMRCALQCIDARLMNGHGS